MNYSVVYLVLLSVSFTALLFCQTRRHFRIVFCGIAVVFAISLFYIRSNTYIDLIRFNQDMASSRAYYGYGGFHTAWMWWSGESEYSSQPFVAFVLMLIAQCDADGILPALSCFIFLSLGFSTILKLAGKFHLSKGNIIFSVIFLFTSISLTNVSIGVRNPLAFAIIAHAFVDDFVFEKRNWTLIFRYVVACLIHPIGLVIVAIRMVYLINISGVRWIMNAILIGNTLFLVPVIEWVSAHVQTPLVSDLAFKSEHYLAGNDQFSSYTFRSEYYSSIFVLLLMISIFLSYIMLSRRYATEEQQLSKTYVQLISSLLLFCIGSYQNTQIFLRLILLVTLLALPIITIFGDRNASIQGNQIISTRSITMSLKILMLLGFAVSLFGHCYANYSKLFI